MEAADDLVRRVRRRLGDELVAAGVYGSTATGEARAHSDIDLLAVVRRHRRDLSIRTHAGYLVTILQETPEEAEDEVTGSRADLHEALGGWRSMRALYDPTGLIARLTVRARRPTPSQFRAAARKALLEAYEDYGKLLNAIDATDRDEMREMAIWFTGAAKMVVFDLAREVVPTGRRAFSELRRHGPVGEAIRSLRYHGHSPEETRRLAEAIWRDLLHRAALQGIATKDLK